MQRISILICLLFGIGNTLVAGVYDGAFFRIPSDAVSRSVGGPNPAYPIGAVDLLINPALLSRHTQKELQFSNMIDLLSKQYISFAFSAPLNNKNHIGIGVTGLDNSTPGESKSKNVRRKESQQYQFGLIIGYSRNLFPFSLGASIKYFRMRDDRGERWKSTSALGYELGFSYAINPALSAGFIYQSPFYLQWKNGILVKASGKIGMGIAWTPAVISENFLQILLSADRFDNEPLQANVGVVVTPITDKLGLKDFSLRGGIGNFDLKSWGGNAIPNYLRDSASTFTVGAGLGLDTAGNWGIDLDYCFQLVEYITNSHIITTRIRF
ncbi:MAG: hypothetical protein HUU32_04660 [Calditrichaceae bacterium]|nr:hypothetical protein [Calditrichia bacterium]NUQ40665.1 hypothetical protein [Calditrichaceae bacterium]